VRKVTFLSSITCSQIFQPDWVTYSAVDICNASYVELGCHIILSLLFSLNTGILSSPFSNNINQNRILAPSSF